MKIYVLGSSAGGGFPQWNCNCENCREFRRGTKTVHRRTQSSIAVSSDHENWTLVNASPDILTQIINASILHPSHDKRESKIKNILLMDAQIDHVTGLLMLREGCPHLLYCTKEVYEELNDGFPIFRILSHWEDGLQYKEIKDDVDFEMSIHKDVCFHAIPLISNAPPYSKYRDKPRRGDNIGLFMKNKKNNRSIFYAPGLGEMTKDILSFFEKADILLIDGTFWDDSEMIRFGASNRTAIQMGHLPISGNGGLLEVLEPFKDKRRILIHINNTNPILNEDSKERNILSKHGIEVSYDGMVIDI